MSYEWIKVVHLLAVISWMAGLFYLPRLFVYHVDQELGSPGDEIFKLMERRLMKAIMRPAALVSLLSGLALLQVIGFPLGQPWLWIKLVAVLGMVIFHGSLEFFLKSFARGRPRQNARFFRIINEVPTLLLVIIVVAVVVRPFS